MMPARTRLLALSFAAIAYASTLAVYLKYDFMAGFPDGYLTTLDRAQQSLYLWYAFGAFCFSAGFLFLATRSADHRIVVKLAVAFALFYTAVAGIDLFLGAHLEDGWGG